MFPGTLDAGLLQGAVHLIGLHGFFHYGIHQLPHLEEPGVFFNFDGVRMRSRYVVCGYSEASKFVVALYGRSDVYSQQPPTVRTEKE